MVSQHTAATASSLKVGVHHIRPALQVTYIKLPLTAFVCERSLLRHAPSADGLRSHVDERGSATTDALEELERWLRVDEALVRLVHRLQCCAAGTASGGQRLDAAAKVTPHAQAVAPLLRR